jgi:BMFP domain-containing protein YqiC
MSEIQKYHLGWDYEEADMYPSENGDYVLYTDHLDTVIKVNEKAVKQHREAMAEKDKEIARAWHKFDEAMTGLTRLQLEAAEQIAALTAKVGHLELANTELGEQSEYFRHELNRKTYELEHITIQLKDAVELTVALQAEVLSLEAKLLDVNEGSALTIASLTAEVTTLKDERTNAIRKRMKETLEWVFEGEFEAGTLADLLARSREENAALQVRIKELEAILKSHNETEPCETQDNRNRIKELTEALEKYGSHSPADGSPICERSKHSDYPCTCGFEAALGGNE